VLDDKNDHGTLAVVLSVTVSVWFSLGNNDDDDTLTHFDDIVIVAVTLLM
jgi:hypothetical protein